jgi:ribosomal-protein-alanine N-acetyltransferase
MLLTTPRLRLRPWRESDLAPFAAMNADPLVMEHFPAVQAREESDAFAQRAMALIERQGWGHWALEVVGGEPFIGFAGLSVKTFEAPFTPCTEVGWRLARAAWGHGYATEAAQAAVAFGFSELRLAEIVSYTTLRNSRSIAVMERLGMRRDIEFDHPLIPEGIPQRRHVLYRLPAPSVRGVGGEGPREIVPR